MRPPVISRASRPRSTRPRAAQLAQVGARRCLLLRPDKRHGERHHERGVTLLLVAVAMVAIIGMAALAIDVVTLYLAREEAQRAADAGAIAGARALSLSGVTGDPDNTNISGTSTPPWPAACALATQVAQAVANENSVNSQAGSTTVTFLYNGTTTDCNISGGVAFGLNPQVQVQVVRNGMPSLFSRIWSSAANSVSATATAEAYNSSSSENYTPTGDIVPVAPRCVKPWVIPDMDPLGAPGSIVRAGGSSIRYPGIQLSASGNGTLGIIGEQFTLTNPCFGNCETNVEGKPASGGTYVPALISTSPSPIGVPTCANGSDFQEAIGGCDVATSYACGTQNGAQLDYTVDRSLDTNTAANCLTQSGDTLDIGSYPFQIKAGPSNPYISTVGQAITSSSSIVSLPIFKSTTGFGFGGGNSWPSAPNNQPQITIVGFLQVFIQANSIFSNGNMTVIVLNVAGCGDGVDPTGNPVYGSSPVPVRLITPP